MSYRTTLVSGICGLVLLTGAVVTWLAHRGAQSSTEALAGSLFREVSGHAVTHTRGFVLRAAPLVESLQHLGDTGLALDDSDRLAKQLLAFLEGNPGLSWVSYGDEAGTFTGAYRPVEGGLRINQSRIVEGRTRLIEHDVLPDGSWRPARQEEDSGYDPRTRPFYQQAKQQDRLVWIPPYVFYNQGVPGISCAAPLHDSEGNLQGVLSVDFDLNALSEFVAGLSVSEHSDVFLFTSDDTLLAHKSLHLRAAQGRRGAGHLPTLADIGDPLVEAYRRHLHPEHVAVAEGDAFHTFEFSHGGSEYLASATTFRVGDDLAWVIGAVAPKSDFLSDVWRSQTLALAVSGGALLAALVMAGARAVLRNRADKTGSLASLMDHLNRLIAADHEGTHFMTMHLSIVNSVSGEFRFASAGHDPATIYDPATDRFEEAEGGDLPLGIVDDTQFAEHCYRPLKPGQVIMIGTDGVWEMPNSADELFGKDRMQQVIRSAASSTAAQIVDALVASLVSFRGDRQPVDDVTFVVIKVVSVGSL